MQLKPNFVPKQAITEIVFYTSIFFVVFVLPYFLGFMFLGEEESEKRIAMNILFLGLGSAFLIIIICYFWRKLTYSASSYLFKDDRVEYAESFFNQEEKELHYDRVIEVIHTRSFIQRIFGTGSIVLQTQATAASQHASGLCIKDIFESKARYEEIRSLIDQYRDVNKR